MGKNILAREALLLVTLIFSVLSTDPVRGAEQTLSLPEVIEYSMQHNVELKSFREEKGVVEAAKVKAGLFPNPTLDVEAGTGALTGSRAENMLSVGISQEFLLAGKRGKRLAVAERELDLYRFRLADKERLIREEVQTLFYDLMLAEQRLALADRTIALNRKLLEVSQARLAAGDIPELEMNLVKVELAHSVALRIDIAKTVQQSQEKLSAITALPVGTQYEMSKKNQASSLPRKSLGDLKQLALARRPDIKALEAERGREEAAVKLARAESIPNLTVGLAIFRDTRSMKISGVEESDKAYTLGMRLSIPIPVFDRNQAGVQETSARLNSVEARLSGAIRSVEREVETAYTSSRSSKNILSLYETDIIPQLEENLSLTGEAWRLGEVGIQTVMQEQKKFFEVSDNYLMARHSYQAALVKLDSTVATELNGEAK
ncbi:MAG: TolC family protein [Chlorobiaceae bacterium]|nr:TolC family protein [Chlorobiaceae bacterium]